MNGLLKSRTLIVNGLRTLVLTNIDDEPVSEAVLFVHGNPGSRLDWQFLAGALASRYKVVAVDMPGFGDAEKPRRYRYSVESGSAFLEGLRETLHIERVHLIMHDFGGPWGLHWAVHHAHAFASSILIDTGIMPGYRWHFLARLWRTPILGELFQWSTTRTAFRFMLNRANPRPLPNTFIDQMYDHYDEDTRHAILQLYRATPNPGEESSQMSRLLVALNRPTLVLWGDRDPYLPVQFAHAQRQSFPDAKVVEIKGAGHWPFIEFPELVSSEILQFLHGIVQADPI